jgi:hypothetical protein
MRDSRRPRGELLSHLEQTRLVMTTRTLEARSLRMRPRWEHELSLELAREGGLDHPGLAETAAVAVSCLTSPLRHWTYDSPTLGGLVAQAFAECAGG